MTSNSTILFSLNSLDEEQGFILRVDDDLDDFDNEINTLFQKTIYKVDEKVLKNIFELSKTQTD